jgi:hypothetical protein
MDVKQVMVMLLAGLTGGPLEEKINHITRSLMMNLSGQMKIVMILLMIPMSQTP